MTYGFRASFPACVKHPVAETGKESIKEEYWRLTRMPVHSTKADPERERNCFERTQG